MDVASIYNTAIRRTYTSPPNYILDNTPTCAAIVDLNKIYHDVCADMRNINENYFYERFFFDTVPFKNSYIFVDATNTQRSIQKILSVNVKYEQSQYPDFQPNYSYSKGDLILYSGDGLTYIAKKDFTSWPFFVSNDWQQTYTGYSLAKERSMWGYDMEWNNYTTNVFPVDGIAAFNNDFVWVGASPIYIMGQDRDENTNKLRQAIYIYPFVEEAIVQGIRIEGIMTDVDLTDTSTELDILIERNYHEVLVEGLMWLIYQQQGKIAEAQAQMQVYEMWKKKVLNQMTDRTISPNYVSIPNLYNLS